MVDLFKKCKQDKEKAPKCFFDMRTSVKPTLFFYYNNESGFPIAEKTKTVCFPLPAGKKRTENTKIRRSKKMT